MEDEGLARMVRSAEQNVISEKTRKTYRPVQERFLLFVLQQRPSFLTETVRAALEGLTNEAERRTYLKSVLTVDSVLQKNELQQKCPFVLGNGDVFLELLKGYVVSLNGGKSTKNTASSAILDLPRKFGLEFTRAAELKTFRKGVKKQAAAKDHQEGRSLQEGKAAMSLTVYSALARATLVSAKKVSAFTHVVLVLAWNLGCRVNNVIGLNLAHMGWADDCLRINFALQKNDQEGDQGQQVRHVFANPLNPAVCPILALGVYLLLFTKGEEDVKLFDGSSQYNHFLTALHDFLEDISELLENEGLSPDCFGAHSMRKVCVCAHSLTKVCLCESFGRLM